ncbi:hypothetical protein ACWGE0_44565 [Lentzea sp. NPDC054927]
MPCVFCSIMSGDLPARWVAQAPDASPEAFAAAGLMIQRVARAAEAALRATGEPSGRHVEGDLAGMLSSAMAAQAS